MTVGQTAAIGLTTSSGAAVVLWGFKCLQAHEIVMPDETTAVILAGFIAPIAHSFVAGLSAMWDALVNYMAQRLAFKTAAAAAAPSNGAPK